MPEEDIALQGLSEAEVKKLAAKIGRWVNKPQDASRWVLVRHGIIMFRLGDMIMRTDYHSSADLKDDLREFQDWATTFLGMCDGFKEKRKRGDEEGEAAEQASRPIPWEPTGRQGSGG